MCPRPLGAHSRGWRARPYGLGRSVWDRGEPRCFAGRDLFGSRIPRADYPLAPALVLAGQEFGCAEPEEAPSILRVPDDYRPTLVADRHLVIAADQLCETDMRMGWFGLLAHVSISAGVCPCPLVTYDALAMPRSKPIKSMTYAREMCHCGITAMSACATVRRVCRSEEQTSEL